MSMIFFLLTSDILLSPKLSWYERSSPARALYRNALCRVSVQHAGQKGFDLSVGKICENDKGVSHAAVPIYVKYVMRRSLSPKAIRLNCSSFSMFGAPINRPSSP